MRLFIIISLSFLGTEYITQLDEVMAVSGGEVIIPCYYSKDISDITKVTWYYADRETNDCTHISLQEWRKSDQYVNSRYSLVNFTQDISLRIHNLHVNDQRSYCCVISTSTARATLKSEQFTRLVVAEYQSSWNQPTNNITSQERKSVILTCSYTLPSDRYTERDVVRVNVYWRVGNITGPYAYHPYREMVHSTYRHRTFITEMTNLMINDVTKADNTSFHCFVVVKRCAGDYQYDDDIQYGGGTRLIINDDVAGHTTNGENYSAEDRRTLMIIIVVSSITIMIILIVILIILKVKGVICKKKTNFSEQQMDSIQAAGVVTSEEAAYCEISTKKPGDVLEAATDETKKTEMESGQMEEGEEGNLLYAKLDQSKLKEKRPAENPMQNEDVVYADVVKTTPK
ncbi:uncharacterized protein [Aquarana catesbeiana]|uniref:uncharacterized protein isoform X2 n=1 Tax=Aquarana catesbeiana TaxID=8400 RepID=UPI003CC9697F